MAKTESARAPLAPRFPVHITMKLSRTMLPFLTLLFARRAYAR
jgi:hypothetical protein